MCIKTRMLQNCDPVWREDKWKEDQVKILLYDCYLTHFLFTVNFWLSVKWLAVGCIYVWSLTETVHPECLWNPFNCLPGETRISFPLVKWQESGIKQPVPKDRTHSLPLHTIHVLWNVNNSKKYLCLRQFKQVSCGLHHITRSSLICPHGECYWLWIGWLQILWFLLYCKNNSQSLLHMLRFWENYKGQRNL